MKDKTPEQILYELEYFGIPTRDWSLKEAQGLISQGKLSRQQVDEACSRYQVRVDADNSRKYGMSTPTEQQRLNYSLRLIEDLRREVESAEVPANFVNMYSGKYSNGDELHTSGLGGCTATLLYFERRGKREGILTHYAPLNIDENIKKLKSLRDLHMQGEPTYQKGVVLVEQKNDASALLQTGVQAIFPGITLDTILYDQSRTGKVTLNPSGKVWISEQHGVNSF